MPPIVSDVMAKTDSFFIRQTLNADNTEAYKQEPIDLGAYVDALGKAVLRIHNISISYTDLNGKPLLIEGSTNGTSCAASFQLCTQTQTDFVLPGSSKSVVASGRTNAYAFGTTGNVFPSNTSDALDNAPQMWNNGYLIGVETLYFGGAASTGWHTDVFISIVMECTSETLTPAAAMALALSQQ